MRSQETDSDRVAVRSRAGRPAGTNAAVGTADIFDDDGLIERYPHTLAYNSRDHIRNAARRQGHDDGDGARRISLCRGDS